MKKHITGPAKTNQAGKAAKRKAPFKRAGAGIEAHGTVSGLSEHHDGASVHMSVKHGKPKTGGDGIFDTFPDQSSFTMPPDAAKQFTMGQRVRIRVHPHGESAPAKNGKSGTKGKRAPRSKGASDSY